MSNTPKRKKTTKGIGALALIMAMLLLNSCTLVPGTVGTTDTVAGTETAPSEESKAPGDPDKPESEDSFSYLVGKLSPVAAWDCEAGEPGDEAICEAVSGARCGLIDCTLTDGGYTGSGIYTNSQTGGYLDIGSDPLTAQIKGKSAITVSMWIMPYINYNSTNYRLVSFPVDGSKVGFSVYFQSTGIQVGGRSCPADSYASANYTYQLENNVLGTLAKYSNEGQWQHIVASVDYASEKVQLYVNGTQLESEDSVKFSSDYFDLGSISESFTVGGAPAENVYSFNGIMDNIFVFDRTLSVGEIGDLYSQSGSGANSPIADELLVENLLTRMADDAAFCEGMSNYINGGMVKPLSSDNTALTAVLSDGEFYIPVETAGEYFSSDSSVDVVQINSHNYKSLKLLCEESGKTLLTYGSVAVVMSQGGMFSAESDATLLDRLCAFFSEAPAKAEYTDVEGSRSVIAKSGDFGTVNHCATPSITEIGDTVYTSMDSNGNEVYVYSSTDGGESFEFMSKVENLKFATIFALEDDLYLIGVRPDNTRNLAVITKSSDGGRSWSDITQTQGMLAQSSDGFNAHCSSTAVLFTGGRIYKAYSGQSTSWRKGCTAYIESADVTSDLLDPSSWTVSSPVSFDTAIFNAHPSGSGIPTYVYCQEGNAVLAPDGSVWGVYRIDCSPVIGYAVVMKLSPDGKTLSFDKTDPESIISFPGGNTKCTIKYDPSSGKYLSLVNNVVDERSWSQRNVLSLSESEDLLHWTVVKSVLIDRSVMNDYISITRHGFQYVDWVIDGDDILMAVRESMGDSQNFHNANNLTFYRLAGYKSFL